jgi:hypothetical protein
MESRIDLIVDERETGVEVVLSRGTEKRRKS